MTPLAEKFQVSGNMFYSAKAIIIYFVKLGFH